MKALISLAAALACGVALAGDGAAGCGAPLREEAKSLKVHFRRTPGVGDFQGAPDVTLDAKDLSAEEARDLRKLVQDADFFKLSSTTLPQGIPDPPAGYDLKVEMDGQEHSIWVSDFAVGKELKPLIDRLTARTKDRVMVEFKKSGGIAGMRWKGTVDSAALSADDAAKLRKLVADAKFFDVKEKLTDTHIADGFGYTITVEMDGKRHTVQVYDDTMPDRLWPLVEWLDHRADLERPAGR